MFSVKGSLNRHLSWWPNNISNKDIVRIVDEGYRLPLSKVPQHSVIKNNKSARDNAEFVGAEIDSLLQSGLLQEVSQAPTIVNALTVAVNHSGKKRLVLDLREINPLLTVAPYKYEDITVASSYLTPDCFLAGFDLKQGYHHIDIHPAYRQYLGFAWDDHYYVYTSCPFGISVGGLVFSKVLRELVRRWRTMGISMVLYLDDGIIIGHSKSLLQTSVDIVRADLTNAGFVINEAKSNWEPCQRLTWLGFILDSAQNIFEVPAEKLARIRMGIHKNLIYKSHCGPRELAKTVGRICSLYHVFGSIVYVLTKDSSRWISDRDHWNTCAPLSVGVIQELEFWQRNLSQIVRLSLVTEYAGESHHLLRRKCNGLWSLCGWGS
jgi:hypothetical protein